MVGTCLTRDADLRTQVESRVARGDVEVLASLPGGYHHLVPSPDGMLVSSHAGHAAPLVNAPSSREWLAARGPSQWQTRGRAGPCSPYGGGGDQTG